MKPTTQRLKGAENLCDEIGPDDGIDPRHTARRSLTDGSRHKQRQFCKAAHRTVNLLLCGEFRDPLLDGLTVADVRFNSSALLISIRCKDANAMAMPVLEKLHSLQGPLRAAIARSVNRRRVPSLRFEWVRAECEEQGHART